MASGARAAAQSIIQALRSFPAPDAGDNLQPVRCFGAEYLHSYPENAIMTSATIAHSIQPHNEKPASVWSSGGRAYDRVSHGIADAIEHCVQRLAPRPGERVLDVATGTGWTSRLIARRGAIVTATDIAGGLLDAARDKAIEAGLDIDYRLGDAESLPFEDAAFDAVISTFGVMFASRPEAAATELARVCRPGGRVALATWSPDGNVFGMFKVMKRYMPPPPVPAPPSPFEWGNPERVRQLLGEHFDLRFEKATSFYREASPAAAWDTFSNGYGPVRALAANLEETRRHAFRADFEAFHAAYATDLGTCVPRDYLVAVGTRR
jgi:SAM-dependent methyltransferase